MSSLKNNIPDSITQVQRQKIKSRGLFWIVELAFIEHSINYRTKIHSDGFLNNFSILLTKTVIIVQSVWETAHVASAVVVLCSTVWSAHSVFVFVSCNKQLDVYCLLSSSSSSVQLCCNYIITLVGRSVGLLSTRRATSSSPSPGRRHTDRPTDGRRRVDLVVARSLSKCNNA